MRSVQACPPYDVAELAVEIVRRYLKEARAERRLPTAGEDLAFAVVELWNYHQALRRGENPPLPETMLVPLQ